MVIRFAPNKNNNQKVVEEQAVWRGTNFYVKVSFISLKVSAICTVQQYLDVIKFHEGKLRPVYDKTVHEQTDKKCLKHTNSLIYLPSWHFQHICGWIPIIYEIFDQIPCLKINLVRR